MPNFFYWHGAFFAQVLPTYTKYLLKGYVSAQVLGQKHIGIHIANNNYVQKVDSAWLNLKDHV